MSQAAKNRRTIEKQAQLKHDHTFDDMQGANDALLLLALLVICFLSMLVKYGFI